MTLKKFINNGWRIKSFDYLSIDNVFILVLVKDYEVQEWWIKTFPKYIQTWMFTEEALLSKKYKSGYTAKIAGMCIY